MWGWGTSSNNADGGGGVSGNTAKSVSTRSVASAASSDSVSLASSSFTGGGGIESAGIIVGGGGTASATTPEAFDRIIESLRSLLDILQPPANNGVVEGGGGYFTSFFTPTKRAATARTRASSFFHVADNAAAATADAATTTTISITNNKTTTTARSSSSSPSKSKSSSTTTIPRRLQAATEALVTILRAEEDRMDATAPAAERGDQAITGTGPFLQRVLNEELLEELCGACLSDAPCGVRLVWLRAFGGLVGRSRKPLFIHQGVLRPFRVTLQTYGDQRLGTTAEDEAFVALLAAACRCFVSNPACVPLFLRPSAAAAAAAAAASSSEAAAAAAATDVDTTTLKPKPFSSSYSSSSSSSFTSTTTAAAAAAAATISSTPIRTAGAAAFPSSSAAFPVFEALVPYMHADGALGSAAQEAILLCLNLASEQPDAAACVAEGPFCRALAAGMAGLYSTLPAVLPNTRAAWRLACNDVKTSLPQLGALLTYVRFCDRALGAAPPQVARHAAHLVYEGFLRNVILPSLHQADAAAATASTAYFDACLCAISDPCFARVLLRVVMLGRCEGQRTLSLLTCRMAEPGDLGLVTMRLMLTLMDTNCEDVMLELCLRDLQRAAAASAEQVEARAKTTRAAAPADVVFARAARRLLTTCEIDFAPAAAAAPPPPPIPPPASPANVGHADDYVVSGGGGYRNLDSSGSSGGGGGGGNGGGNGGGGDDGPVCGPELHVTGFSGYLRDAASAVQARQLACKCWSQSYEAGAVIASSTSTSTSATTTATARANHLFTPSGPVSTTLSTFSSSSSSPSSSSFLAGNNNNDHEDTATELPGVAGGSFWAASGASSVFGGLKRAVQGRQRSNTTRAAATDGNVVPSPTTSSSSSSSSLTAVTAGRGSGGGRGGAFNGPGLFLETLLNMLEDLLQAKLGRNLLLTQLLSRLAQFPQPLLRDALLGTGRNSSSSRLLLPVLRRIAKRARTLATAQGPSFAYSLALNRNKICGAHRSSTNRRSTTTPSTPTTRNSGSSSSNDGAAGNGMDDDFSGGTRVGPGSPASTNNNNNNSFIMAAATPERSSSPPPPPIVPEELATSPFVVSTTLWDERSTTVRVSGGGGGGGGSVLKQLVASVNEGKVLAVGTMGDGIEEDVSLTTAAAAEEAAKEKEEEEEVSATDATTKARATTKSGTLLSTIGLSRPSLSTTSSPLPSTPPIRSSGGSGRSDMLMKPPAAATPGTPSESRMARRLASNVVIFEEFVKELAALALEHGLQTVLSGQD